jgi:Heliorhodopsin
MPTKSQNSKSKKTKTSAVKPAKKTVAKTKAPKKITMQSLKKWNLAMAAIHFVQGVAILILSNSSSLPVTTNFLTLDTLASKSGSPVLVAASRHLFDINLAYLVAAFFFLSAAAHLIIATVYRKNYEKNLSTGINKARWFEYGISASVMMVAIAMLTGVYDLSSLLMIFGLIAIMNLMGLVMEVHNQTTKKTNWLSFIIGCKAGIIPWLVVAIYVLGARTYGSGVPGFVYWIYLSMFIFFSCFALNMYLQYKKVGKWADYLYGERVYMILSLVAKSLLAWQVFFGTLRP